MKRFAPPEMKENLSGAVQDISCITDLTLMFEVRPAPSWSSYEASWEECMRHVPWRNSGVIFWYDWDVEKEGIQEAFKGGNLLLEARSVETGEPWGVLGVTLDGKEGKLRPWEPGVRPDRRETQVGEKLITEAVEMARSRGIENLKVTLRYPCNTPGLASWQDTLYRDHEFEQWGPTGLQMIADLTGEVAVDEPTVKGVDITGRESLRVEDLVHLTLEAFTSEPSDREYFSWDPLTTTEDGARDFYEGLIEGEKGVSPPEFFRVAWVCGEPVGFAGSFILCPEERRGIIGPVGVLPEYRRRGIGEAVVLGVMDVLRRDGCVYAYLGTNVDNLKAIALYEKLGFEAIFHTVRFEKTIK